MKHILIFGGTGFIGRHLFENLKDNYHITIPSRNPQKYQHLNGERIRIVQMDQHKVDAFIKFFDEADAVINLAGENVGSRWSVSKKQAIRSSRLDTDKFIVDAFNACKQKPTVVLQGSGMGVYGFEKSDDPYTEESPLGTKGFLTEVGISHEQMLKPLERKTRLIYLRTGLVLDGKEGALPPMAMPFKLYGGGPVGNGLQWNSWIHIKDEVMAIRYLLENKRCEGAYNLTAPHPVTNNEFAKTLGKVLQRPSFFRVPSLFLKLGMGEMADELLLSGLKIIPKRLIDDGFKFKFEHIHNALGEIYNN